MTVNAVEIAHRHLTRLGTLDGRTVDPNAAPTRLRAFHNATLMMGQMVKHGAV